MRCAAVFMLVIAASIGCKNQSTPLTNPFLTPDRVSPPSTGVLAPGTAQPYYQGAPLPGAAPLAAPAYSPPASGFVPPPAAAPTTPTYTYPGATYPGPTAPATTYPGSTYPASPVTPTTPPTGYGVYPPQADGDAVAVPTDEQALRFASASLAVEPPATDATTAANVAASSANSSATFRTPIQSMLPLAAAPQPSAAARAFTPNAGAQAPVEQAAYNAPLPGGGAQPQQVQIREITPTELAAARPTAGAVAPASASSSPAARDGFRPQGSEPRAETLSDALAQQGFRPPSIGGQRTADDRNATGRFGVGPQQEWLRGQLEYWPQTGEWSIRYMGDGPVDQLGGRVLIDNPQVLGNLPPGEFVMVEGQLYGRPIDDNSYRPAYRIATVQRQRQ